MDYYERIYKPHENNPLKNRHVFDTKYYNNKKRLTMEPKKKINWLKIWQIIRDILVTLLTTDAIVNKV